MKLSYKKGKWIVSIMDKVFVCEIVKVDEKFYVTFEKDGKKITIRTNNLDYTFKAIEDIVGKASLTNRY